MRALLTALALVCTVTATDVPLTPGALYVRANAALSYLKGADVATYGVSFPASAEFRIADTWGVQDLGGNYYRIGAGVYVDGTYRVIGAVITTGNILSLFSVTVLVNATDVTKTFFDIATDPPSVLGLPGLAEEHQAVIPLSVLSALGSSHSLAQQHCNLAPTEEDSSFVSNLDHATCGPEKITLLDPTASTISMNPRTLQQTCFAYTAPHVWYTTNATGCFIARDEALQTLDYRNYTFLQKLGWACDNDGAYYRAQDGLTLQQCIDWCESHVDADYCVYSGAYEGEKAQCWYQHESDTDCCNVAGGDQYPIYSLSKTDLSCLTEVVTPVVPFALEGPFVLRFYELFTPGAITVEAAYLTDANTLADTAATKALAVRFYLNTPVSVGPFHLVAFFFDDETVTIWRDTKRALQVYTDLANATARTATTVDPPSTAAASYCVGGTLLQSPVWHEVGTAKNPLTTSIGGLHAENTLTVCTTGDLPPASLDQQTHQLYAKISPTAPNTPGRGQRRDAYSLPRFAIYTVPPPPPPRTHSRAWRHTWLAISVVFVVLVAGQMSLEVAVERTKHPQAGKVLMWTALALIVVMMLSIASQLGMGGEL